MPSGKKIILFRLLTIINKITGEESKKRFALVELFENRVLNVKLTAVGYYLLVVVCIKPVYNKMT